ncbi:MAG: exosome complex exonuclease Rrp41 [Candidatus Staskawiczbacteria bacterium RIFCSPHIGHO2_01_FULL_34_27]|uniref:Exosome complex exonuclease Rrp41 n=1 Tax=Candidatus Staskawiczbacteria bacterium RIFCSPHIGHO2_01_FULL_34_27 TaxID=1802199 RepID=A0A1G2HKW5_9BACT|nr:exosome complex exonuclease Rrp41 [Candidatus Pacearchaeota archaeon]OGZ62548.1 MAG: exosome complex exonuclease Rrp41 [Candidatus Staskawiczbacteria bacterium RIFCSPHIGHO2_01_FULL_34_27]
MTKKDFKRSDGRKFDEVRKMTAKVGVIPNADGSAMFSFGDTIAIAAVYGPKKMHPQHLQNPEKGVLRYTYHMMSFSVTERIRPGPNRRSMEISKISEWALEPVVMIDKYPGTVIDVHVNILQANASTRCAGINAAALAIAHAGVSMKDMVSSVSIGKLDKQLVVDVSKDEEDYEEGEGATDIPITFTDEGKITHIQVDGSIETEQLKEAIQLARKACKEIYEVQKKALKESLDINKNK